VIKGKNENQKQAKRRITGLLALRA
jgi:hypothetical protein